MQATITGDYMIIRWATSALTLMLPSPARIYFKAEASAKLSCESLSPYDPWEVRRGNLQRGLPIVSIVVSFWGYLIGSLIYNWLNQKKELQWRL